MKVLRQILSILLLPFVVTVVIPAWLFRAFPGEVVFFGVRALGMGVFVVGFGLFGWCVALFARVGQGTLAPWDPTRRMVAVGPYQFVRNPMISGVALMLIGEALFWGSVAAGVWAG
nr:methyltransferase [Anaerolineales bacterium]